MKKEIFDFLKTIIIAGVIAILITFILKPTLVKGNSMNPTLDSNNYLVIEKTFSFINNIKNDDIIVFKTDLLNIDGSRKDLIKRVIGIPNDRIEIKNGNVYINKKKEDVFFNKDVNTSGDIKLTVPKDKFFVLGDNRANSLDSRSEEVGLIDKKSIEGKVIVRLFPFNRIGRVK
ncbi:signal peptidase I [Helicovermis profundi]|uniref:Signal peptidase I n=1 Tax=Helicovermis profundi TaxID=3065157 RepID=A0AAU9E1C3_9FIRM|nr:signal peptidase I [Clostridia bacterium S502]